MFIYEIPQMHCCDVQRLMPSFKAVSKVVGAVSNSVPTADDRSIYVVTKRG